MTPPWNNSTQVQSVAAKNIGNTHFSSNGRGIAGLLMMNQSKIISADSEEAFFFSVFPMIRKERSMCTVSDLSFSCFLQTMSTNKRGRS